MFFCGNDCVCITTKIFVLKMLEVVVRNFHLWEKINCETSPHRELNWVIGFNGGSMERKMRGGFVLL